MDSSTTNQTYTIFDPQVGFDQYLHRTDIKTTNTLNGSALLPNAVANPTVTNNINSGEMPSLIGYGKYQFSDTNPGWLQGLDVDNKFKWFIGTSTSSADWNVTTPDTFTIKGAISATTGTIGGFVIGADFIRDLANSFGLASTVTGGDDVRFWAGSTFANRNTAPFRLTESGVLTITNNISQTIVISGGQLSLFDSTNTRIFDLIVGAGTTALIRPTDSKSAALVCFNQGGANYTASGSPISSALINFKIFNSGSSADVLYLENIGSGHAFRINQQGSGIAALINQNANILGLGVFKNSGGVGVAFTVLNNGTGTTMELYTNGNSRGIETFHPIGNNNNALRINNAGGGTTFDIEQTNAGNIADAIFINNAGTGNYILTSGGAKLTNAGVWTNASSRGLKENVTPIEYDILEKLKKLEVPMYTYICEGRKKFINPDLKADWHITPMAEDFYEMFGVGDDKSISPADMAGVALIAIQQLLKKLNI